MSSDMLKRALGSDDWEVTPNGSINTAGPVSFIESVTNFRASQCRGLKSNDEVPMSMTVDDNATVFINFEPDDCVNRTVGILSYRVTNHVMASEIIRIIFYWQQRGYDDQSSDDS